MWGNQEIKFVTQFTNISFYEYNAPVRKTKWLTKRNGQTVCYSTHSHDDKSVMLTAVLPHTQHKSMNKAILFRTQIYEKLSKWTPNKDTNLEHGSSLHAQQLIKTCYNLFVKHLLYEMKFYCQ